MATSLPARPLAQKLLAAHPHDFDFLYLSGILENQGGRIRYRRSKKHLEEAITLNPDYYNAHYNLGLALSELKDFPRREGASCKRRSNSAPPSRRFTSSWPRCCVRLGETEQAQAGAQNLSGRKYRQRSTTHPGCLEGRRGGKGIGRRKCREVSLRSTARPPKPLRNDAGLVYKYWRSLWIAQEIPQPNALRWSRR